LFGEGNVRVIRWILLLAILWIALDLASAPATRVSSYESLRAEAEALVEKGEFARAREVYLKAAGANPPAEESQWVEFRLADTRWRAEKKKDPEDWNDPRGWAESLRILAANLEARGSKGRLHAEVEESLGDFYASGWDRSDASEHYTRALEYWASSRDLAEARKRYLQIVLRWVDAPDPAKELPIQIASDLPVGVLENAVRLSDNDEVRSLLRLLLAIRLEERASCESAEQVRTAFDSVIRSSSPWYHAGLFYYARWLAVSGKAVRTQDGECLREPDWPAALAMYQRLLSEFSGGKSVYYADAAKAVFEISWPALRVSVNHIFLPGSDIEYEVNWRNGGDITMGLYPLVARGDDPGAQIFHILEKGFYVPDPIQPPIKTWTLKVEDRGDHALRRDVRRLSLPLQAGAYILDARTEKSASRQLLLVTDVALALQETGGKVALFAFGARDGKPVPGARIQLKKGGDGPPWKAEVTTDKSGFASADGPQGDDRGPINAVLVAGDRLALASGYWFSRETSEEDRWTVYAFTDRPAYRPGEQVQWKIIGRVWDGADYKTAAGQDLAYEVRGPMDDVLKSGVMRLDDYGAAWGALDLPTDLQLGYYGLQFKGPDGKGSFGHHFFFRVEEYKLPEFRVSVKAGQEKGAPKTYKPGDRVSVEVKAEYYFGGPVERAPVTLVVRSDTFVHRFPQEPEFSWMAEGEEDEGYGGYGEILRQETLPTGDDGRLLYTFEVPKDIDEDTEFNVEARVTEASTREVVERGSFRVTRAPYFMEVKAARNLVRPGEEVEVNLRALDANDLPVKVRGTLSLLQSTWDGKEGDSVPFDGADRRGGGVRSQGQGDFGEATDREVLAVGAVTGADGKATVRLRPPCAGFYKLSWTQEGAQEPEVSEGSLWAADETTRELGQEASGLIVVCDRESYRVGDRARILMVAPSGGRTVLITTTAPEHSEKKLLPMAGTALYLEVPILDFHRPLVQFSALAVGGSEALSGEQSARVPFIDRFLSVEVTSGKSGYAPRDEASFSVRVRDAKGAPASAQLAFSVSDDAVRAIQEDRIPDIRKRFYEERTSSRPDHPHTSFDMWTYRFISPEPSKGAVREAEGTGIFAGRGGMLRGLVLDNVGQAIPGAEVVVMGGSPRRFFGTVTNLNGEYQFPNLPPMTGCTVRAEAQGYGRVVQKGISIRVGRTARLQFKLAAGKELCVTGGPAGATTPLDAPLAYGYDGYFVFSKDRSSSSVAYLAPSIIGSRDKSANENVYLLNGLDTTGGIAGGGGSGQLESRSQNRLVVRHDYRPTAFWAPDLVTGADGTATARVKLPDSLTTWRAVARAQTRGNDFGQGDTTVRTDQPLQVRLQTPRFLVVGDEAAVSAIIDNRTDAPANPSVELVADGVMLRSSQWTTEGATPASRTLAVPAHGQARADWKVSARLPGTAKFTAAARCAEGSDAMERVIPVYDHGIEKQVFRSGKLKGSEARVALDLPKARKKDATSLRIELTPTMAASLVGALPYLVDFPYGCTEQTMSRFLPAVIVQKTLKDLGIQPDQAMEAALAFKRPPANDAGQGAKADLGILTEVTTRSLHRLSAQQGGEGSWGWWAWNTPDPFMTAYVVWGLSLARDAGVEVREEMLDGGQRFLEKALEDPKRDKALRVWMLHAAAANFAAMAGAKPGATNPTDKPVWPKSLEGAWSELWGQRQAFNPSSRALLALTAFRMGKREEGRVLVRELEKSAKESTKPGATIPQSSVTANADSAPTAHWGEDQGYRRWSDGPVGSTSFALMALLAADGGSRLVDPAVAWLVQDRRGAHWRSTLDSAVAILALSQYLKVSKELESEAEVEIVLNGATLGKKTLGGPNTLATPVSLDAPVTLPRDGPNSLVIRKVRGGGAVYYGAMTRYFSTEEPVKHEGGTLVARRDYYRLKPVPTLLQGFTYDRVLLKDGATVQAGERLEVVLTLEAKDGLEYIMVEDLKAAGLEAVQLTSGDNLVAKELSKGEVEKRAGKGSGSRKTPGENRGIIVSDAPDAGYTQRSRGVYQELKDRKVALFIDDLPAGSWEIRYGLRAETPGTFHALPVIGQAMYAPEIRTNGAEVRIGVSSPEETVP
jgi:uncharacterized protein YfaS (alpha-2-macroglobulin family)/tetratricopeptide (TPR) repeat protein